MMHRLSRFILGARRVVSSQPRSRDAPNGSHRCNGSLAEKRHAKLRWRDAHLRKSTQSIAKLARFGSITRCSRWAEALALSKKPTVSHESLAPNHWQFGCSDSGRFNGAFGGG